MKNKHTGILSLGIGIGIVYSNAAATFQSSGKIKYTDQTTGNTVVFDSVTQTKIIETGFISQNANKGC